MQQADETNTDVDSKKWELVQKIATMSKDRYSGLLLDLMDEVGAMSTRQLTYEQCLAYWQKIVGRDADENSID